MCGMFLCYPFTPIPITYAIFDILISGLRGGTYRDDELASPTRVISLYYKLVSREFLQAYVIC